MEIRNETISKIWNYLAATQIWQDVEPLMHEIDGQIKAQPKPVEPEKLVKDAKKV